MTKASIARIEIDDAVLFCTEANYIGVPAALAIGKSSKPCGISLMHL